MGKAIAALLGFAAGIATFAVYLVTADEKARDEIKNCWDRMDESKEEAEYRCCEAACAYCKKMGMCGYTDKENFDDFPFEDDYEEPAGGEFDFTHGPALELSEEDIVRECTDELVD